MKSIPLRIEPLEARIAPAFAAVFELSGLTGAFGFKISGVASGDFSGYSVSEAGDINGDGIDDLIVGADNASPNGSRSGASYVVFGSQSGFAANLNLSALTGGNGFRISGETANDSSGRSVSGAGDINGDGIDDLIVGAYGTDPNGLSSGASYVVFGSRSGFAANLNLSTLTGGNGFKIGGVAAGDQSSVSVSGAGDINGDGIADLIGGAHRADPNGYDSGASYVVFGSRSGFAANLNLSTLTGGNGFKISGVAAGDYAGFSVSEAGDINGDGIADLIVGAPAASPNNTSSGASYVVFGKATAFGSNLNLSTLDGSNGFKLNGVAAGDRAGTVRGVGDINGDGIADLLIGARSADASGTDSGTGYVVFGHRSLVLPPTVVTTEIDVVDSNDGLTSLREAILFANSNPGRDIITFAIGQPAWRRGGAEFMESDGRRGRRRLFQRGRGLRVWSLRARRAEVRRLGDWAIGRLGD